LRCSSRQITLAIAQLAHRIDSLSASQDRTQQLLERLGARVDQLTSDVLGLAAQLEQQAQLAEQDRNQAAIDRAEFRSTVEQLLQVLVQRFNGNGRTGE